MAEPNGGPTLRVCALYPDLMNIYADRGNMLLLERRCAWRGIGFELHAARPRRRRSTPTPTTSSTSAAARTATRSSAREDLVDAQARRAARRGRRAARSILGVCGGYQLLGHSYELGDEEIPGIGLVDLRTVREDGPRLIGNVAIEVELPGATARACSPASRTTAGARTSGAGEQPLGRVLRGHGNTGASGVEGVRRGDTSSAPTCTARCCRRTRGSPTG